MNPRSFTVKFARLGKTWAMSLTRHAEPLAERRADLVDRDARDPRAIVAGVHRPDPERSGNVPYMRRP